MTPSFVAVLPAIMPDLARRCITSMAPELRSQLLLVDNTGTGAIADEHAASVWFTARNDKNAGVTAPWEEGRVFAESEGVDWLVLVSQSMQMGARGGLDLIDALKGEKICVHGQYGWHYIAWSMHALGIIGPFDMAFPIMGADTDLLYRAHLAGLPSPRENGGRYKQIALNASCEPPAACLRAGVVKIRYQDHLERYRAKWGSDQGRETFMHPYDNPDLDHAFVGDPPGWSSLS